MKAIVFINRRTGFIQIEQVSEARTQALQKQGSDRAERLSVLFGALVKQHKRRWPLAKMVPR